MDPKHIAIPPLDPTMQDKKEEMSDDPAATEINQDTHEKFQIENDDAQITTVLLSAEETESKKHDETE